MNQVELSPLRPLDDFLLQMSRFQLPNMSDPEKWANRVINNLLYYQSNYIVLAIIVFLLVGVYHPVDMLLGCVSLALGFACFSYVSDNQSQLRRLKRNHPGLAMIFILGLGYFLIYFFGSIMVFLFGIALPLLVIFVHASLRLRNLKNKVANKLEYVGLKRTPMGLFLEALGLEEQAAS